MRAVPGSLAAELSPVTPRPRRPWRLGGRDPGAGPAASSRAHAARLGKACRVPLAFPGLAPGKGGVAGPSAPARKLRCRAGSGVKVTPAVRGEAPGQRPLPSGLPRCARALGLEAPAPRPPRPPRAHRGPSGCSSVPRAAPRHPQALPFPAPEHLVIPVTVTRGLGGQCERRARDARPSRRRRTATPSKAQPVPGPACAVAEDPLCHPGPRMPVWL